MVAKHPKRLGPFKSIPTIAAAQQSRASLFWLVGEVDDMKTEQLNMDAMPRLNVAELRMLPPETNGVLDELDAALPKVLQPGGGPEESRRI